MSKRHVARRRPPSSATQGTAPTYVTDLRHVLDDADVDAVIIATPEHWHALATVWACQAGKHVLVEKNLARTIWEGRQMIDARAKHDRASCRAASSAAAPTSSPSRDYIASGASGHVMFVKVFGMLPFVYGTYPLQPVADSAPPPGLDWDRWLGPAPAAYNAEVHRNWYGHWDFSGGNASDAVHTLDVARMVLGDPLHPRAINCAGGRWQYDDGGDMPDVQIVTYEFDRLVMTFENTGFTPYMFKTPQYIRDGDLFPFWPQNSDRIEIYGTKQNDVPRAARRWLASARPGATGTGPGLRQSRRPAVRAHGGRSPHRQFPRVYPRAQATERGH